MTSSNRSRRSLASRSHSRHSGNHRRTDNRPYRLRVSRRQSAPQVIRRPLPNGPADQATKAAKSGVVAERTHFLTRRAVIASPLRGWVSGTMSGPVRRDYLLRDEFREHLARRKSVAADERFVPAKGP